MNSLLVKGIVSAIGLGGTIVGGYYGVEALTNEKIPLKNTIERQLRRQGYTIFILNNQEWQAKFNSFKSEKNLKELAEALKEGREDDFKVEKETENTKGGEALNKWCKEVLDLEKDKGHKTIANAKLFCAEQKSPKSESKQK